VLRTTTIIYLGPEMEDTQTLMKTTRRFLSMQPREPPYEADPGLLQRHTVVLTLLPSILSRPWFRRVWVFQELVLSGTYGYSVDADDFDGRTFVTRYA
jgi:hypothetical protein